MNSDDLAFHALHLRQRDLLDELDALEQAIAESAVPVIVTDDSDPHEEQQERLAWLYRQQAGVRAVLSETERALLAFG